MEGPVGGGKVEGIPFVTDELTLGNAMEHNIPSAYLFGLSFLEEAFGFTLGGLISHAFFRRYTFTLNFDSMKYYLKKDGK